MNIIKVEINQEIEIEFIRYLINEVREEKINKIKNWTRKNEIKVDIFKYLYWKVYLEFNL